MSDRTVAAVCLGLMALGAWRLGEVACDLLGAALEAIRKRLSR